MKQLIKDILFLPAIIFIWLILFTIIPDPVPPSWGKFLDPIFVLSILAFFYALIRIIIFIFKKRAKQKSS